MIGPMILTRHKIRIARDACNLSQRQLAFAVGVHTDTVKHWEDGTQRPRPYALRKVAAETGCDVEWLLHGVPNQVSCPVCWRPVAVVGSECLVVAHNDNAHSPCPMTGHPAPRWVAEAVPA